MIQLTITWGNGATLDIQVNKEQRIMDVLKVLCENHLLAAPGSRAGTKIYSQRKMTFVNQLLTFAQAGIYYGDMLKLCR